MEPNEIELNERDIEEVISIMSNLLGVDETALTQSWDEHQKSVEDAAEKCAEASTKPAADAEDEVVDLSTVTLVDKLETVVHDTCDALLIGSLSIESGEELKAIVESVAIVEHLKAARNV